MGAVLCHLCHGFAEVLIRYTFTLANVIEREYILCSEGLFGACFYAIIQKSASMAENSGKLRLAGLCEPTEQQRQGWEYVTFIERIQRNAGKEGTDCLSCCGGF